MNFHVTGSTVSAVSLSLLVTLVACGKNENEVIEKSLDDAVAVNPAEDNAITDHNNKNQTVDDHDTLSALQSTNSSDTQMDSPQLGQAHKVQDSNHEEHVIDQLNKSFSESSITVNVGDKIKFVNSDSYFHNVYSLSEAAQFDLGSYPKGESRTVSFDKPGKIMAHCAIHPQMQLEITVED